MKASREECVVIEGAECLRESAKAIQVRIENEDKWIPKSLIHDDSECHKADTSGTLIVPAWFAEKEGLS